jgi:post-segregation antitoxin (ccd killing protein)
MATKKVTITMDEDLLNEFRKRHSNLSAAISEAARWYYGFQRQNEALEEFIEETGVEPDPQVQEKVHAMLEAYIQRQEARQARKSA